MMVLSEIDDIATVPGVSFTQLALSPKSLVAILTEV
jgi:hypothetical protein